MEKTVNQKAWFLVVPVLLATALILVVFRLRPEARTTLIKSPARIRPADRRVLPFLLAMWIGGTTKASEPMLPSPTVPNSKAATISMVMKLSE